MTARQMHLTMWYAGHEPYEALRAAYARVGAWPSYMIRSMYAAHLVAQAHHVGASEREG